MPLVEKAYGPRNSLARLVDQGLRKSEVCFSKSPHPTLCIQYVVYIVAFLGVISIYPLLHHKVICKARQGMVRGIAS